MESHRRCSWCVISDAYHLPTDSDFKNSHRCICKQTNKHNQSTCVESGSLSFFLPISSNVLLTWFFLSVRAASFRSVLHICSYFFFFSFFPAAAATSSSSSSSLQLLPRHPPNDGWHHPLNSRRGRVDSRSVRRTAVTQVQQLCYE